MAIKARIRRNAKSGNDAPWRSRIVGEAEVDPRSLTPNPENWRKHPQRQQDALTGVLNEVGWVQRVVQNARSAEKGWPKGSKPTILDGHARVELAVARGEKSVPIVKVDLTQEEERLVLATLDPIGALAEADDEKLEELLADLDASERALLDDVFDLQEHDDDSVESDDDGAAKLTGGMEYRVVVECTGEADQALLMEQLEATGRKCRPLIS